MDFFHRSRNNSGHRGRIVALFEPGCSTAAPSNRAYRLGKLSERGLTRGRWLDCGCADGGYTAALFKLGADSCVGVDPDDTRISRARHLYADVPEVEFYRSGAEALPFPAASFDGVLLNEVLEHVRDEVETLHEIRRVLKPGGHLAVMTPNRGFPFEGHGMRIGDRDINFPIPLLPWIPRSVGQRFMRARNYWAHELEELIRAEGFVIREVGYLFPMFEVYRWMPRPLVERYRVSIPVLERAPLVRSIGNSVFVWAQIPGEE